MSRIGRLPIEIPAGVTVSVSPENLVVVKGPLGELSQAVKKEITVKQEGNIVTLSRNNDSKDVKALHGLYRKLIFNMVEGVTKGFKKILIINGVGFKAVKEGNSVVLSIGYSHTIKVDAPEGVKLEVVSPTEVHVVGIEKDKVGQCAANIKRLRIPDPYHAYGIRYSDEEIARKEGKKAGK